MLRVLHRRRPSSSTMPSILASVPFRLSTPMTNSMVAWLAYTRFIVISSNTSQFRCAAPRAAGRSRRRGKGACGGSPGTGRPREPPPGGGAMRRRAPGGGGRGPLRRCRYPRRSLRRHPGNAKPARRSAW